MNKGFLRGQGQRPGLGVRGPRGLLATTSAWQDYDSNSGTWTTVPGVTVTVKLAEQRVVQVIASLTNMVVATPSTPGALGVRIVSVVGATVTPLARHELEDVGAGGGGQIIPGWPPLVAIDRPPRGDVIYRAEIAILEGSISVSFGPGNLSLGPGATHMIAVTDLGPA